jgi:hypothetical protein
MRQMVGGETLMVGGGIAGRFDLFGPALQKGVTVTVVPSLLGEDAQVVGAASCVTR